MRVNNIKTLIQLSYKQLIHNKLRNVMVIISATLMTAILSTILIVGLSMEKTMELSRYKSVGTCAHAQILNVDESLMEYLNSLDYIENIGKQQSMGTIQKNNVSAKLFYADKKEWEKHLKPTIENFVGALPKGETEILASYEELALLGYPHTTLGDDITVNLAANDTDGRKPLQLRVVGLYNEFREFDTSNEGRIFVSKNFNSTIASKREGFPVIYASLGNSNQGEANRNAFSRIFGLGGADGKTFIGKLQNDINDFANTPYGINVSSTDTAYFGVSVSEMILTYLILILPCFLGGFFMVYVCFYLSLSKDLRQYGLLSAIGITYTQLKVLSYLQATFLTIVGFSIGCILSIPLSHIYSPRVNSVLETVGNTNCLSWNISFYAIVLILVGITVLIGCAIPLRQFKNSAIMNALKLGKLKTSEKKYINASSDKIYKMAFANLRRNTIIPFLVIPLLFVGIMGFLISSSICSNMNTVKYANLSMGTHDIALYNSTLSPYYNTNSSLKAEQKEKFDDLFIENVKAINGVTNVFTAEQLPIKIDYFENAYTNYYKKEVSDMEKGYFKCNLFGIDTGYLKTSEVEELKDIDIKAFENGEIALLSTYTPEVFEKGDLISATTVEDNVPISLSIGGFLPPRFQTDFMIPKYPDIYVHKNVINQYSGTLINRIDIDAEKNSLKEVELNVESLIGGDPEIEYAFLSGEIASNSQFTQTFKSITYVIASIAISISLLTFLNVMIINMVTRKSEFTILRSIGMTNMEIARMVVWEAFYYWIGTLALVVTIGSLLLKETCKRFYYQFGYEVTISPWLLMIETCIILLAILVLIMLVLYRHERGKSLSNLLKDYCN